MSWLKHLEKRKMWHSSAHCFGCASGPRYLNKRNRSIKESPLAICGEEIGSSLLGQKPEPKKFILIIFYHIKKKKQSALGREKSGKDPFVSVIFYITQNSPNQGFPGGITGGISSGSSSSQSAEGQEETLREHLYSLGTTNPAQIPGWYQRLKQLRTKPVRQELNKPLHHFSRCW